MGVQITIQTDDGKTYKLVVPEGMQIATENGTMSLKSGSIINLSPVQAEALLRVANADKQAGLSKGDLTAMRQKGKNAETIFDNLPNGYKVGTVMTSEGEPARMNCNDRSMIFNFTKNGKTVNEDDNTAKFLGIYFQK
jgi:hypothetical protein